jgi:hypothetical protein
MIDKLNPKNALSFFLVLVISSAIFYNTFNLLNSGADLRFLNYFVISATLIFLISRIFRINYFFSTISIFIFISIISKSLIALLSIPFFFLAAIFIGFKANSFFTSKKYDYTILILIGFAVIGFFVTLLSFFRVNYFSLYFLLSILPILAYPRESFSFNKQLFLYLCESKKAKNSLIDLSIFSIFFIYFLISLAPESGYDALVTHLFVPTYMNIFHIWNYNPDLYTFSVGPMFADFLFSYAYFFGNEKTVHFFNISFLAILCSLISKICSVIGYSSESKASKLCILTFISIPLTFAVASSLFVEVIWTVYFCALFYTYIYVIDGSKKQNYISKFDLLLLVLFTSVVLSCKMISFLLIPGFILIAKFSDINKILASIPKPFYSKINILFFLIMFIGLIPYITAYYITNNPVFPFFNHIFKSAYFGLYNFAQPFNEQFSFRTFYDLVFNSSKFLESGPGASGYQFLILLIPSSLIMLHYKMERPFRLFIYSIFTIFTIFSFTSYMRYVFPIFPILLCSLFVIFSMKINPRLKILANTCFIVFLILNLTHLNTASRSQKIRLNQIFSAFNNSSFESDYTPMRKAISFTNKINKASTPIAILSKSPVLAELRSEAYIAWWYNDKFSSILINDVRDISSFKTLLNERKIQYLIIDDDWIKEFHKEFILDSTVILYKDNNLSVSSIQ